MRPVRIISWMLIFVAVGAVATAWLLPRPDTDEGDAETVALGALASAGIEATLDRPVIPSGYVPAGGDPIDVWVVFPRVGEEIIEMRVDRDSGQLVWVNDNIGADGAARLLDDNQFAVVEDYRSTELRDWIQRNAAGSLAAAVIALVGFVLSKRSDRLWTRPAAGIGLFTDAPTAIGPADANPADADPTDSNTLDSDRATAP